MSVRQRVFAVGFLVVLLSCADVLATNKEGLTCELALSNNNVTVGDPLILRISFVNKSERGLQLIVPDKREQAVESWIVLRTRISMKKGKTDIDKTTTFMKEWVDMTQDAQLAAGKSLSYSIDIRRLFKIPFDEEGNYILDLEANGVKAAPLKFTIKKRDNTLFQEVARKFNEKESSSTYRSYEYVVEEAREGYTILQRQEGAPFSTVLVTKSKPLDFEVKKLERLPGVQEGVFMTWIDEEGINFVSPCDLCKTPLKTYQRHAVKNLRKIRKVEVKADAKTTVFEVIVEHDEKKVSLITIALENYYTVKVTSVKELKKE